MSSALLTGLEVALVGDERALFVAGRHLADLGARVAASPRAPGDRADQAWLGTFDGLDPGRRPDVLLVGESPAAALPAARVTVRLRGAGSSSASAGARLDERELAAISGIAAAVGEAGRDPLPLPDGCVDAVLGLHVAGAALHASLAGASEVEVAAADVATWIVATNRQLYVPYGLPFERCGRRASGSGSCYPYGLFEASDGLFCLIGRTDGDWDALRAAMGRPAWADEPRFSDPRVVGRQYPAEADVHVNGWASQRTREQLMAAMIEHNFPGAPVLEPEEVLALPSLAGSWRRWVDPVVAPAAPCAVEPTAGSGEPLPLEGALVLDLAWVWSGPAVSVGLADLGATVVKVESATRPDNTRLRGRPVWAADHRGPERELAPYFHVLNRGKRSVTLDLKTEEGRSLLRRLAGTADVIVENLSPGVMDRLGVPPGYVLDVNPSCVYLSMRGYPDHPSTRGLRAYAPALSSSAGVEALVRYPGEPPVGAMTVAYSDALAASNGLLLTLAGLVARARTGGGAAIVLSQFEATVFANGHNLARRQLGLGADGLTPITDSELVVGEPDVERSPWISPDLFTTVRSPDLGAVPVARLPWRRDGAPLTSASGAGPRLGEHTEEELGRRLGLDAAALAVLGAAGALT